MKNPARLSNSQIWFLAARPKTLPAAAASVVLASSLAYKDGSFSLFPALAAFCISILLQVGANFANDLFDFQKGADTEQRLGPTRVTQAGLLTPDQIKIGMIIVFAISIFFGLYLTWIAGWTVVLIGISAILAAIAYTGGPFPYGYHALGDLFVFIFFGLIAVCGTYFVQSLEISMPSIWAGCAMGSLITNILVVNNLRDVDTDRKASKITLAVRVGKKYTRLEYIFFLFISYTMPLILTINDKSYSGSLLTWISLPIGIRLVLDLFKLKEGALNNTLAGTAQLSLIYAVLFSAGILLIH